MIITISGYNGVGKSTLARDLVQRLNARGIEASHSRFDALYPTSLLRKKTWRIGTLERAPTINLMAIQGKHASWDRYMCWYHCVNMLCAGLFLLGQRWFRRRRVVVFDRYYFDRLIHFRPAGFWYRLFIQLAPQPDVGFVLLPDLAVWESRMLDRVRRTHNVDDVRIAGSDMEAIARVWERFRNLAKSTENFDIVDSTEASGLDSAWAVVEARLMDDELVKALSKSA